jgi:hypothetical protein
MLCWVPEFNATFRFDRDMWFSGTGEVLLDTKGESWRFVDQLFVQPSSPKLAQPSEMSLSLESFQNSVRGEQLRTGGGRCQMCKEGRQQFWSCVKPFPCWGLRLGCHTSNSMRERPPISPEGWPVPGEVGCRNAAWRITNLTFLGAQNGRCEACSYLSTP